MFALALFLLPAVATGIKLQRVPLLMIEWVGAGLLILLVVAVQNQGREPLEQVQVCQTPSNLAGCADRGYVSQPIDAAHDIPVAGVPDIRPTPLWANSPGGPP
jgi:hypothetical protein